MQVHETAAGKVSMDKKKLALIHIIKKELNLSDSVYREILQKAAGVTSAKDLDEESFRRLMNYFVRSEHYRINPAGLTIKQKLYIKFLAQEMGWTPSHLSNFIHKYYHTFAINDLSRKDAMHLIESLKNTLKHQRSADAGNVS